MHLKIYKKYIQTKIEKEERAYAAPTCSSSSTKSTETSSYIAFRRLPEE